MMTMNQESIKENSQIIKRPTFIALMSAALEIQEYQFARQAGLSWLANFPGDLPISLLYAKALIALNKRELAISHLEKIINYDIEYIEPLSLLVGLVEDDQRMQQELLADLTFLTGQKQASKSAASWLDDLLYARKAFEEVDYKQAEKYILNVMAKNPQTPLPAILHLKIVQKQQNPSLFSTLASIYLKRWPNSNQIRILAALSMIENGNDVAGVENLHWSAAHDTTGQVISRILGAKHQYIPLWPENMQIFMELPVPASVAAELGWNRLSNGLQIEDKIDPKREIRHETVPIRVSETSHYISKNASDEPNSEVDLSEAFLPNETEKSLHDEEDAIKSLNEIQGEFDRMAKSLKNNNLLNTEGRFPSYVIITSKSSLIKKYGENTAGVIDQALKELTRKITALPNWNSLLFYPDDPTSTAELGLTPQLATDAWKVKLSLTDLDKALGTKGEMIGALLIIGGNDIIPLHQLPNPTDDSDQYVASDNPYATTDENYYVPQWPVGRIPDEAGSDAGYLLEQIRYLDNEYAYKLKSKNSVLSSRVSAFFQAIVDIIHRWTSIFTHSENIGYAAEAWQQPSEEVFGIIGSDKKLVLSPPIDFKNFLIKKNNGNKCAYFNLHGLQESGEWYGQKDFTRESAEVDYPVALVPAQFIENESSPEFIFSEACYGAWINDKKSDESLALKFMEAGTRSMIGSTGIAYGSVRKPLVAADLLAQEYWKQLLNGQPSGYALLRAKLNLACKMTERQGFLDGEDQKTILSFVLYGDPLANLNDLKHIAKPLYRPKAQPKLKTISDSREEVVDDVLDVPVEILEEVKSVVKAYLPGLENAQMNMNPQLTNFSLSLPDGKRGKNKKLNVNESQRYVVTLKKTFERESVNHIQFARMTFDYKGHMIKLSTSR